MNRSTVSFRAALATLVLASCATSQSTAPPLDLAAIEAMAPGMAAIVVMRHGEIAEEAYFADASADTLLNTRSVTKTVTAMLVGAAIEDGLIVGVEAPVAPLVWSGEAAAERASIRIEDFLTMSSALNCNDSDPANPGNEENMYPQQDWHAWARALSLDPAYARDEQGRGAFRYCTGGVVLLGAAIEAASGSPMDVYAQRRLLTPLGIEAMNWTRSPVGQIMPGGGLELRARDLAKLGALLADRGRWNGQQILPAAFVDSMLSTQRTANAEQRYGYLIWRRTYVLPCGQFELPYMAGTGGNAVVIVPQRRASVVVARTAYRMRGVHPQTTALLEQVLLPPLLCPG